MRTVAISAFAVTCCLGWIEASAQAADIAPPNPPRTQQEIMQERRAACRDLRGAELRECMNNYVGTPDRSQSLDSESGKREDKPDPPPATEPQPKPNAPSTPIQRSSRENSREEIIEQTRIAESGIDFRPADGPAGSQNRIVSPTLAAAADEANEASDVVFSPRETTGQGDMQSRKLGRTGALVSIVGLGGSHIGKHERVLAQPSAIHDVIAACFRETRTIWLRHHLVSVAAVQRKATEVASEQGTNVRVKVVERPDGGSSVKAEADDSARAGGGYDSCGGRYRCATDIPSSSAGG